MTKHDSIEGLEVGYDIPAAIGMAYEEIQTPCLILDLDALERNVKKMGDYASAHDMRHRAHGKMHKSVDVLKLQMEPRRRHRRLLPEGLRGRGLRPRRHQGHPRLQRGPRPGEDRPPRPHAEASAAASSSASTTWRTSPTSRRRRRSTAPSSSVFVEIDCGAGRCGVTTTEAVVEIAKAVAAAPGLRFLGIQAYQGAMQHLDDYEARKAKLDAAIAQVKDAVDALKAEGLEPELVSGGGTGSYYFECNSGVYNELQCGSYAFMDADYGRIHDKDGNRIDQGEWENALFILTSVMSHAKPAARGLRRRPQGPVGRQRPAVHLRPRRT